MSCFAIRCLLMFAFVCIYSMFNTHSQMLYDNQLILNYSSHGILFYITWLVELHLFYHNICKHRYSSTMKLTNQLLVS